MVVGGWAAGVGVLAGAGVQTAQAVAAGSTQHVGWHGWLVGWYAGWCGCRSRC
jgi:hypothetical protein